MATNPRPVHGEMLKIREVAERLDVDESTIRKWILYKGLRAYGISGRSRWLDWDEVVAWLKEQPIPSSPPSRAAATPTVIRSGGRVLDLPRR